MGGERNPPRDVDCGSGGGARTRPLRARARELEGWVRAWRGAAPRRRRPPPRRGYHRLLDRAACRAPRATGSPGQTGPREREACLARAPICGARCLGWAQWRRQRRPAVAGGGRAARMLRAAEAAAERAARAREVFCLSLSKAARSHDPQAKNIAGGKRKKRPAGTPRRAAGGGPPRAGARPKSHLGCKSGRSGPISVQCLLR
ncbi:MAG: hypothetical protein J3K34DRAFT_397906 [Monoraphidium minutum]|nr:MAG: hypothetical protein J3K34DRAFT_397906 [Monoraphidium minutum]